MGDCIYCHKPAGWLKSRHDECETSYRDYEKSINIDLTKITKNYVQALTGAMEPGDVFNDVADLKRILKWNSEALANCLAAAFETALDKVESKSASIPRLTDLEGLLDRLRFYDPSGIESLPLVSRRRFDYHHFLSLIAVGSFKKASLPRSTAGLHYRSNEHLLFHGYPLGYYSDVTRRKQVSKGSGVNLLVTPRVDYRSRRTEREIVENTELEKLDRGHFGFTEQRVFFIGEKKSFHWDFSDIEACRYSDTSLSIFHRDESKGRAQFRLFNDNRAGRAISILLRRPE